MPRPNYLLIVGKIHKDDSALIKVSLPLREFPGKNWIRTSEDRLLKRIDFGGTTLEMQRRTATSSHVRKRQLYGGVHLQ